MVGKTEGRIVTKSILFFIKIETMVEKTEGQIVTKTETNVR